MTLHGAKGLEFDTVFIAGMEEGLFPHSRALLDTRELEEERRLCYVGITRAKRRLYLLWAVTRNIFGSVRVNVSSRFLEDIPEELREEYGRYSGKKVIDKSESAEMDKIVVFRDGERVEHPVFGEGVVISTKDDFITVAFMKKGIKKISPKYAKLKKI
jgi:DNA helicase II / ATP-dependent DNA helicase PcrA